MKNKQEIVQRTKAALAQIRPFLEEDGGDVKLIEVTDDLVARVEFKGTCIHCSMNTMTFRAGVQDTIRKAVPEIAGVEAINLDSPSEPND